MRNFQTSKSKYKNPKYFVNRNDDRWEVVEFPTNDVVRSFKTKREAELLSEQITKTKPFGDRTLPKFMKGDSIDIVE